MQHVRVPDSALWQSRLMGGFRTHGRKDWQVSHRPAGSAIGREDDLA